LLRIFQPLIKYLPKPPPLDFQDRQAARDHLTYSVFPTRGVIETDKLLAQMREVLSEVSIPTLVIHSLSDRGVPIENAHHLANAITSSNVETLFVEQGGHVVLLEPDREIAADAIAQFIKHHSRDQP
jgi:esterase/lipase